MSDDPQFDAIERDLGARLGASVKQVRARRTHCPPLASLRARAMGTMPDDMLGNIQQHIASCGTCAALAEDLQEDQLTAPTAAESQRIFAHVAIGRNEGPQVAPAGRASRRQTFVTRFTFFGPLLAGAAGLLIFVWTSRDGVQPTPAPPVAEAPATAPVIPPALRLEMPDLRISASAVLVTRGEGGSEQYLKDLAAPFDAYRAGNYADAARLLAALETTYPKATEVFFYGGVSRLHEQEPDQALHQFERARAIAEPEFSAEVSFYLALALHRAGRVNAARGEFDKLCAAKSEFQTRACEAARAMIGSPPR